MVLEVHRQLARAGQALCHGPQPRRRVHVRERRRIEVLHSPVMPGVASSCVLVKCPSLSRAKCLRAIGRAFEIGLQRLQLGDARGRVSQMLKHHRKQRGTLPGGGKQHAHTRLPVLARDQHGMQYETPGFHANVTIDQPARARQASKAVLPVYLGRRRLRRFEQPGRVAQGLQLALQRVHVAALRRAAGDRRPVAIPGVKGRPAWERQRCLQPSTLFAACASTPCELGRGTAICGRAARQAVA